jgi:hypothetical protein
VRTLDAVFAALQTAVAANSRFQTGGIYRTAQVIDLGNSLLNPPPDGYGTTVTGRVLMATYGMQAPGVARTRLSAPALGAEILWNSGSSAIAAPAGSPAIFVMARGAEAWQAPADSTINSGQRDNDASIALILRFNSFFYYTGGDLPSEGEDLIATAIMAHRLPDPQDDAAEFALPASVACFKCGHHGSNASTSQNFLDTVMPRVALISCGRQNAFHHPGQDMIDRLHGDENIGRFFLTNCEAGKDHVPASDGENQLADAGNKSRVAGTNQVPNLRHGDIRVTINTAESTAADDGRQFKVRFYENTASQNFRTATVPF